MKRGSTPGVFLVSQAALIGEVIEELVLIWSCSEPDEWENRIVDIPE